jgi:hypothetical protein
VRNPFLRLAIRWWWSRWHPLVRVGWNTLQTSSRGANVQTLFGGSLIAAGLVIRARRRNERLLSTIVPAGGEYRIRVVDLAPRRSEG